MSAVTNAPVIHDKMAPMVQTAFSVFTQMGCSFHFSHFFPFKHFTFRQTTMLLTVSYTIEYLVIFGEFKVIWVKRPSSSSVGPLTKATEKVVEHQSASGREKKKKYTTTTEAAEPQLSRASIILIPAALLLESE